MKLQDRLPDSVRVDGRRYRLDLDFRNVLRLLDVLARSDLVPGARDWLALRCVMRRPPRDPAPVLDAVRKLLFSAPRGEDSAKKMTDFVQDADLIRAAFWQTYRVNLYRDRLHWLEFTALLNALPEGSRYSEIIGIRARPMPKATKYNAEERAWLAKAKAAYALELTDEERERAYDHGVKTVFAALMGLAKGSETHGE